ncbi:YeeE/YedE family protein [Methylocapsa acidiphila]|uniref:YeeE/YedE family protein n=1 Tax=Methylocapsa acidiphila TaxID=133552 RepID=UPI0003FBE704|nr:YeeE/YedE thiosulfate transporter family protein [Methylocapsa acidiphila]
MASFISPIYLQSLAGGALIGLASALYLLLDGRIAGVSGIVSDALRVGASGQTRGLAFVVGLVLGPVLYRLAFGAWPPVHLGAPLWLIGAAGLLVGVGTRLGSGCTSGHGVCGLARLSPRSMVAVATFLAAGVVTVATMNALRIP